MSFDGNSNSTWFQILETDNASESQDLSASSLPSSWSSLLNSEVDSEMAIFDSDSMSNGNVFGSDDAIQSWAEQDLGFEDENSTPMLNFASNGISHDTISNTVVCYGMVRCIASEMPEFKKMH